MTPSEGGRNVRERFLAEVAALTTSPDVVYAQRAPINLFDEDFNIIIPVTRVSDFPNPI